VALDTERIVSARTNLWFCQLVDESTAGELVIYAYNARDEGGTYSTG
jgi:hypothetical protein